jgi:hypothetical protein
MDDEANAAREYDRLRAELAEFVLDALAERMAKGQQPELSQALVEAIDRRVEQAVAVRVGSVEFPDPDAFADSVIAAAAGRSSGGDRYDASSARARRNSEGDVRGRAEPQRSRTLSGGQKALIALIGVAVLAVAAYFLYRALTTPATNTQVFNVTANGIEPTPDGASNAQQPPPPGGTATPGSAGAPENVQGLPR